MSFNSLVGIASHSASVALFALQETTGTAAVDSNGTLSNATIVGMGANPTTTTGPNSWLTSAFSFDGTDDILQITHDISAYSALSIGMWVKSSFMASTERVFSHFYSGGDDLRIRATVTDLDDGTVSSLTYGDVTTLANGSWFHIGISVGSSDSEACVNGVSKDTDTITFNFSGASVNSAVGGKWSGGTSRSDYGLLDAAGLMLFPSQLSAANWADIYAGPEPECTVAPTVSGDTAQGSTLTCSPGTWALPSPFSSGTNGTVTYTYQWTRDGGDISGATSSTYVTQAADIGTAVGCKVLGVNDGGSDTAEQTASSNTISVVAAGPTYRMNMQLFIPTQV